MGVILLVETVITFILMYFYHQASLMSGRSSNLAFCYGHPYNPGSSLEERIYWIQAKNGLAMIGLLLVIGEVLIYSFLFVDLSLQNQTMAGVLSKATLQNRKKGNVMTLMGQVVCFLTEGTTVAGSLLMANIGLITSTTVPTNVVLVTIQAPMLSLALIVSSPELKRHFAKLSSL